MSTINIGINEENRELVASQLKCLLADSYTLYLQTHNFHWNITGPLFVQLHTLFEEHYTELAVAVDDIAERIRAQETDDESSAALISDRMRVHEKTAWMLRSQIS